MQKFTCDIKLMTVAGTVFRDANTIGYNFVNNGNCIVWVNNLKLLPGQSWKTFEPNMLDVGLYRVRFDTQFQKADNLTCSKSETSFVVIIYNKIN